MHDDLGDCRKQVCADGVTLGETLECLIANPIELWSLHHPWLGALLLAAIGISLPLTTHSPLLTNTFAQTCLLAQLFLQSRGGPYILGQLIVDVQTRSRNLKQKATFAG
jgi:hypothetical protein